MEKRKRESMLYEFIAQNGYRDVHRIVCYEKTDVWKWLWKWRTRPFHNLIFFTWTSCDEKLWNLHKCTSATTLKLVFGNDDLVTMQFSAWKRWFLACMWVVRWHLSSMKLFPKSTHKGAVAISVSSLIIIESTTCGCPALASHKLQLI